MRRPSWKTARVPLLVILLLVLFGVANLGRRTPGTMHRTRTNTTDLSLLIARVDQRPSSIERVVFNPGGLQVTATLRSGRQLEANYPSDQSALKLQDQLERQKVDSGSKGPTHGSALGSILSFLLPILLLTGIFVFLTRRMRGGAGGLGQVMSLGKSKAKRLPPDVPTIGFKDVAGVDEAVEGLQ